MSNDSSNKNSDETTPNAVVESTDNTTSPTPETPSEPSDAQPEPITVEKKPTPPPVKEPEPTLKAAETQTIIVKKTSWAGLLALFLWLLLFAGAGALYWQYPTQLQSLFVADDKDEIAQIEKQMQQTQTALANLQQKTQQSLQQQSSQQSQTLQTLQQQLNSVNQSVQQRQSQTQKQLEQAIQAQLSDVKNSLSTQQKKFAEQERLLAENLQKLDRSSEEAKQALQQSNLQELVSLAAQQLFLANNKEAALRALEMAHQTITINSAQSAQLKEALSLDIGTLKALPEVNTESLYYQLSQVMIQVEKLPLKNEPVSRTTQDSQPSMSEEISWQNVNYIWQDFLSLFKPYRHDEKRQALLNPEQMQNLRWNLISKLNQAQWAALRQQPEVYQESLKVVTNWLNNFYDLQNSAVKGVQQQLQALQQSQLKGQYNNVELSSVKLLETAL